MNTYSKNLIQVKDLLGSWDAVGEACGGLSGKAIMKWRDKGKPPRTEYSSETNYADSLALASKGQFNRDDFLPAYVCNVENDITA